MLAKLASGITVITVEKSHADRFRMQADRRAGSHVPEHVNERQEDQAVALAQLRPRIADCGFSDGSGQFKSEMFLSWLASASHPEERRHKSKRPTNTVLTQMLNG